MNPMQQLADDQQITLEAFQAALRTFQDLGKPLPDEINAIVDDLENNIDRLHRLSKLDRDFAFGYQTARSALQSQTGERNKRLTPINGNGTIEQKADTVPTIDPPAANSKTPTPTESPPLKRFVLPINATEAEKQYFDQYIAQLKQLNPQWVVSLDYCNPGEAEAYIMIYKDDNYVVNHAMYSVDKFLARAFTRTFS
jgi:hypothetical protein